MSEEQRTFGQRESEPIEDVEAHGARVSANQEPEEIEDENDVEAHARFTGPRVSSPRES